MRWLVRPNRLLGDFWRTQTNENKLWDRIKLCESAASWWNPSLELRSCIGRDVLTATSLNYREFGQALAIYTEALSLNPNSAVIYLNRSAAFLSKQQYAQSLNDANHAIELAPNWSKPQKRQAVLLELLNRDIDANYSFLDAVEKVGTDPTLDDETKQKEYKDLNKRMYDLVKKINKPEIRAPTGQMGFLIPDNPGIRVKVAKERKVAEGDTSWPEVGMYHRKLLDA